MRQGSKKQASIPKPLQAKKIPMETKPGNPLISVILPFYRCGEKLDTAVRSIVNQTLSLWELILVNNNACKISEEIALRWIRTDPRVRMIREREQSVASAMNSGLRNARAPLVARMDADDISFPDRLKKQADFLGRHPETGAVSSRAVFKSELGNSTGFSLYVRWQNSIITHREHYLSRFIESPLAQPTIMFRKELIDRYGEYSTENLPEDYELWLRWFEKGVRFYKIPEPLVQWNDHGERLTRTHPGYSEEAFRRVRYEYLSRWLVENLTDGRKLVVCGASRNIIRKAGHLSDLGVDIHGFTDVRPRRSPGINFIPYRDLADPEKYFILNLISKRGAGEAIRSHFTSLGFIQGQHFILAG